MEVFVVGVEFEVPVAFGQPVRVVLHELQQVLVVERLHAEGDDFVDGKAYQVVGLVAQHAWQIF